MRGGTCSGAMFKSAAGRWENQPGVSSPRLDELRNHNIVSAPIRVRNHAARDGGSSNPVLTPDCCSLPGIPSAQPERER